VVLNKKLVVILAGSLGFTALNFLYACIFGTFNYIEAIRTSLLQVIAIYWAVFIYD